MSQLIQIKVDKIPKKKLKEKLNNKTFKIL